MKVRMIKKCSEGAYDCKECILGVGASGKAIGSVVEVVSLTKKGEDLFADEEGRISRLFDSDITANPVNIQSWCSRDLFDIPLHQSVFGYGIPGHRKGEIRYIPHESGFFKVARTWKKL